MSSLLDRPTREALDRFGRGTVPGAGSAVALTGALAARLARAADSEGRFPLLATLAAELEAGVDRDALAFSTFWQLLKEARSGGQGSPPKAQALSQALHDATVTPLAIAQICQRVADIAEELVQTGLPAARAEAMTAERLASAAGESACFIVRENLRFARGAAWSVELAANLEELEASLALRQTDPPGDG